MGLLLNCCSGAKNSNQNNDGFLHSVWFAQKGKWSSSEGPSKAKFSRNVWTSCRLFVQKVCSGWLNNIEYVFLCSENCSVWMFAKFVQVCSDSSISLLRLMPRCRCSSQPLILQLILCIKLLSHVACDTQFQQIVIIRLFYTWLLMPLKSIS